MEQVSGMVSREAKDVLRSHKRLGGFTQQGQALEDVLLKFNEGLTEEQKTGFMKIGATVMLEVLVADGLLSADIIAAKDAIAEEAIRRYEDPMSDPNRIDQMVKS